ncbi:MAG: hypothetical protein K6E74_03825, partial [Bacilli bacterium]|nr:hypothetical protein [Bacilli bacterium]
MFNISIPYSESGTKISSVSLYVVDTGLQVGFDSGSKSANSANSTAKAIDDSTSTVSFVINLAHPTTGDTKNYTVNITRQSASSDATLKEQANKLIVSKTSGGAGLSGTWSDNTFTVTDLLECTDTYVYIQPTLNDSVNARWELSAGDNFKSGQSKIYTFDPGNNNIGQTNFTISFTVIPEDQSNTALRRTYTISITRKAADSNKDATFTFEFDSTPKPCSPFNDGDDVVYNLGDVPFSVSQIKFTPTLSSSLSTLSEGTSGSSTPINMSTVTTGVEQTKTIVVTAQDKTTKNYIFKYTRLATQTATGSTFNVYKPTSSNALAYTSLSTSSNIDDYALTETLPYSTTKLSVDVTPAGSLAKAYYLGLQDTNVTSTIPSGSPWVTGNTKSSLKDWTWTKQDTSHDVYFVYCIVAESGAIKNVRIRATIAEANTSNAITITVQGETSNRTYTAIMDPTKPDLYEYRIQLDDPSVKVILTNTLSSQTITYSQGSGTLTWPSSGTLSGVARGTIEKATTITITVDPEAANTTYNKTYQLAIYQVDNRSDNYNFTNVRILDSAGNIKSDTPSTESPTSVTYVATFPYTADSYEVQIDFADPTAKLSTTDQKKLLGSTSSITPGSTPKAFSLTVLAENDTPNPKVITIEIYREEPDTTNTLDEILVNGRTLASYDSTQAFVKTNNNYEICIDRAYAGSVTFSETLTSSKAKKVPSVSQNSDNNFYTYTCSVTPEAGSPRTYTVLVYCADKDSSLSSAGINIYDSQSYTIKAKDKYGQEYTYSSSANSATIEYEYMPNGKVYVSVSPTSVHSKVYGLISGNTTEWSLGRKDIELVPNGTITLDLTIKSEYEVLKNTTGGFNYRLVLKMDGPDTTDTLASFVAKDSSDNIIAKWPNDNQNSVPQSIVLQELDGKLPVNITFTLTSSKSSSTCSEFASPASLTGTVTLENNDSGGQSKSFIIQVQAEDTNQAPRNYKVLMYKTSAADLSESGFAVDVTALPTGVVKTPNPLVASGSNPIALDSNEAQVNFNVVRKSASSSSTITVFNGATQIYSNETTNYTLSVPNGATYTVTIICRAADFAEDSSHMTKYTFTVTRAALSTECSLESIRIGSTAQTVVNLADSPAGSLPTNTNVYQITSIADVTLILVKKDPYSTIDNIDDGEKEFTYTIPASDLSVGNNQKVVRVTAQDGKTSKYYVLNIYVVANPVVTDIVVTNNEGGSVSSRPLDKTFEATVDKYNVKALYSDTKETVTVTLENPVGVRCMIDTANNVTTKDVTLLSSTRDSVTQDITITIYSKDYNGLDIENTKKVYTITVTRPSALTGKFLETVKLNDSEIVGYSKYTNEYNIPVDRGTTTAYFDSITVSEGATYTISANTSLRKGAKNTVTISVQAQDTSVNPNVYTFNIYPADSSVDSVLGLQLLTSQSGVDIQKIENGTNAGALVDFNVNTITYSGEVANTNSSGYIKVRVSYGTSKVYINETKYNVSGGYAGDTKAFTEGIENIYKVFALSEYSSLLYENGVDLESIDRGTTSIFTIKVTRKALNDDAILAELYLTNTTTGEIVPFADNEVYVYDPTDDEDKVYSVYNVQSAITVVAVPHDPNATVVGAGNVNNGTIFDSSSNHYVLKVVSTAENKTKSIT